MERSGLPENETTQGELSDIEERDLAALYQVETRVLNQAIKRNRQRFLEDFMFSLTRAEIEQMLTQYAVPGALNDTKEPYIPEIISLKHMVILSASLFGPIFPASIRPFTETGFPKVTVGLYFLAPKIFGNFHAGHIS